MTAEGGAAGRAGGRRSIPHAPVLLVCTVVVLYVLIFVRGLQWQWGEIVVAPDALPPPAAGAPVPAVQRSLPAGQPAQAGAGQTQPRTGPVAPAGTTKTALPPSDVPPPRNATDERGVTYDAAGVAVLGIDTDTGGVYNVPPGRQVRIGGPTGQLYDVQPGGRITPATRIKEWPG